MTPVKLVGDEVGGGRRGSDPFSTPTPTPGEGPTPPSQLPMRLAEKSFLKEFGGEGYNVPNTQERRYLGKVMEKKMKQFLLGTLTEPPDVYDQGGNTFILMGETGCGKSTQLPQIVYRYLQTKFPNTERIRVAVTEPRRIAAVTLAARVQQEMESSIEGEVAHNVRFDSTFDPRTTRILYMTEGILVQKIMNDPYLKDYNVVVVDEAHERSISTDVILAHLKKLVYYRNKLAIMMGRELFKLKVVVMTATGEAMSFQNFFPGSKVIFIEGRTHPVKINYLAPTTQTQDYLSTTTALIIKLHHELPVDEHFLVFLTGQEEIEGVVRQLKSANYHVPCYPCPLYAALTKKAQDRAFEIPPYGTRKIVIATNIAETSLTIPGIQVVIDAGFIKSKLYISSHGVEAYQIQRVSKSQAAQRAGRAGRECPGQVFRLYSRQEFENFQEFEEPEIERSNLTQLILMLVQLKKLDGTYEFMTPMKNEVVADAKLEIAALNFNQTFRVDEKRLLSKLRRMLYKFPLQPRLAAVLFQSALQGVLEQVCSVISVIEAENLFLPNSDDVTAPGFQKFWAPEGDLITYLNIFRQFNKSKHSRLWCEKNRLSYRALMYANKVQKQLMVLTKQWIEKFQAVYNPQPPPDVNMAILHCFGVVIHWQRAHLEKRGKYYIVENIQKKSRTEHKDSDQGKTPAKLMHAKIHPSSSLAAVRPPEIFFLTITLNEKNDLFLHHCVVYDKKIDEYNKGHGIELTTSTP